ncbi:hypothetical protein Syun_012622 [Stephania yunnanensis]|uniref:Uncharacterized protein n=1 Tax=Stephania yunnanensis TaxID=152371 RepID=A0AAP0K246_9MAGN
MMTHRPTTILMIDFSNGLRGFGEMTDQDLELELNEVGTRLGDPPNSVDDLLGILDCLISGHWYGRWILSSYWLLTSPDAPFEDEQMRDLAKELLDTFTARQMGKVFFTK